MKTNIKCTVILLSIFSLHLSTFNQARETSGLFIFDNGNTLEFNGIDEIFDVYLAEAGGSTGRTNAFGVFFENSIRHIEFSKMRKFRMLNYSPIKGPYGTYLTAKATVLIETVTGIQLECPYIIGRITVKIFDKLTGEWKSQVYTFVDKVSGRLNIREIVFNN